jgi:hypothetical protein
MSEVFILVIFYDNLVFYISFSFFCGNLLVDGEDINLTLQSGNWTIDKRQWNEVIIFILYC